MKVAAVTGIQSCCIHPALVRLLATAALVWTPACGLLLDSGPPRGADSGLEAGADASIDASRDAGFDAATPCLDGETRCGERCVQLNNDDRNCGVCFFDCGLEMCRESRCEPAWVDVAAGPTHTCAQASDGRVFCWGARGNQTGLAGTSDSQLPSRIEGLSDVGPPSQADSLALGDRYSCVLANVENRTEPRCWGERESLVVPQSTPAALPVLLESGASIGATHLCGGASFACSIDTTSTPHDQFCWGNPFTAQGSFPLFGPTATSPAPGIAVRFASRATRPNELAGFDLGDEYGCLSGDLNGNSLGTLCWGSPKGRNHGQEDTGSGLADLTQAFPDSPEFRSKTLDQIEAGELFACGLTEENRQVVCWGGDDAEAEDGSDRADSLENALYPRDTSDSDFHIPSTVTSEAYDLTVGDWHACAAVDRASGFGIDCWGIIPAADPANSTISFQTFMPTNVAQSGSANLANQRVIDLAASRFHTCALFENHELVCWGANHRGQLGIPSTSSDLRGVFDDVTLCAPDDYEPGGLCTGS